MKSVKDLNRILRPMECWFKALFLCERERKLGNLQKVSPNVEVSYKFVFEVCQSLIESSMLWNIGSMLYNAKFGRRIQNNSSGKARQTFTFSKFFLPLLEFSMNLPEVCVKSQLTVIIGLSTFGMLNNQFSNMRLEMMEQLMEMKNFDTLFSHYVEPVI